MKLSFSNQRLRLLVLSVLLMTHSLVCAQEETDEKTYHFNGDVSVTNNGFSFIPTFSLGEPATILDLSIGGKRFAFEPQFRFELAGMKPWSFIPIWRYYAVSSDKTLLRFGVHYPGLSYLKQIIEVNGVMTEQVYTQRWFTPELTFSYKVSGFFRVGSYYIHGFGLEKDHQTKHTDFISLNMVLNVTVLENWNLTWNPQVYYLRMDDRAGFFTAYTLSIAHKDFPLHLDTTMNLSLEENNEIPSKDMDWNVSLGYRFKNEFSKK